MKRMKVATQRDYTANLDLLYLSPRARGVCCISTIICLLIIGAAFMIVPRNESDGGYGSGANGGESEEPTCIVHTRKEPFSEWTHHIRKKNGTDLCRPEVGTLL